MLEGGKGDTPGASGDPKVPKCTPGIQPGIVGGLLTELGGPKIVPNTELPPPPRSCLLVVVWGQQGQSQAGSVPKSGRGRGSCWGHLGVTRGSAPFGDFGVAFVGVAEEQEFGVGDGRGCPKLRGGDTEAGIWGGDSRGVSQTQRG